MPRRRRYLVGGHPFHITNRGVERRRIFLEAAHYESFLGLLERGKARFRVQLLGVCLMPNHFHLVAQPADHDALSAYLHWVQGIHSRDLRAWTKTRGYGHVFQQRYWSGPIEDGLHMLHVLRYVEANPVTGRLVKRAEDWPWGSLALRQRRHSALLDPLPIGLPAHWSDWVNAEPDAGDTD